MLNLNFIKLFVLFFSFILCKKIEIKKHFLKNTSETIKSFNKSTYFQISFTYSLIKSHKNLNIQIENYNKNDLGQIAFYSKKNKYCLPERSYMSINPYGDNFMVINKIRLLENDEEDYENNDSQEESFSLCVYCLDGSNCKYGVTFELNNSTIINNNISFYNYYVYEENQIFNFSIESNKNIIDNNIKENKNIYELYWIKRINNNKFINFNYSLPKEYSGILLKNITNENIDYIDFNIISNEEDFIIVGRNIIVGNTSYPPLKINDIESIGYLDKEILTEECFEIKNLELQTINNLYIRGIIYDKIAQIYFKELNSENIIGEKKIIEGNFLINLTDGQIENGAIICVSFVDESNKDYQSYNNITFKIQLFSNEKKNYNYFFNTLDIPGSLYLNMLSEDEIMIFSGVVKSNNNKISITVNPLYGITNMYLDNCRIFPFCKYEDAFYLTNLEKVNNNKMNDYNYYFKNQEQNLGFLDSYQPLLVIHCPHEKGCLFEIGYFNENDDIILKEEVLFSQNI